MSHGKRTKRRPLPGQSRRATDWAQDTPAGQVGKRVPRDGVLIPASRSALPSRYVPRARERQDDAREDEQA